MSKSILQEREIEVKEVILDDRFEEGGETIVSIYPMDEYGCSCRDYYWHSKVSKIRFYKCRHIRFLEKISSIIEEGGHE
tara:strand:- start:5756 stop:5992 length:237 start_codon:yes stop_codon:yes gene_type:complete